MPDISISVIMPTYNSAATINEAINSIYAQDFYNFELLIIDGVSTDATLSIIEEKKASAPVRTTLISEKDKGIYDAINKGITLAQGEWIYILGSDDKIFEKSTMKKVYTFLKEANEDFVYGDVYMGGKFYLGKFDKEKLLLKNICQQAIFYRKSLFNKLGLFELRYKIYADYIFNISCFFNDAVTTKYIPVTIADYSLAGLSGDKVDDMYVLDYGKILERVVKGKVSKEVLYQQYAKCGLQMVYKTHYAAGIKWVLRAFLNSGNIHYLLMLLPKKIRKPLGIKTFWN